MSTLRIHPSIWQIHMMHDLYQELPGAGDEQEHRQKFLPPLGFTVSSGSRRPKCLGPSLWLFGSMGLLDLSEVPNQVIRLD